MWGLFVYMEEIMINKKQAQEIKKAVLKRLTVDTNIQQAIFNVESGRAVFNDTDLDMVMDCIVDGIWGCIEKEGKV